MSIRTLSVTGRPGILHARVRRSGAASLALAVLVLAAPVAATPTSEPDAPPAIRLFEAGQYGAVVERVQQRLDAGEVDRADLYWAGQSLSRLDRHDEAAEMFQRLVSEGDDEAWSAVGRAAAALERGDRTVALQQATHATQVDAGLFFAHYQLGLVHFEAQRWAQAAAALSRAAEIDGQAAYAHYYAGAAYNKLKRIEPMAVHFQRFLDLAPNAPERESVLQIMRLLKGLR